MSVQHLATGTAVVAAREASQTTATVIFSHGLGDSSAGWTDMAAEWARKLPHIKFVLPTAPKQPVTLNGGMRMTSWYDIVDLSDERSESAKAPTGMEQSAAIIKSIIAEETKNFGTPRSRMVLGGFSQGAALSLWTGLQLPGERVAGVVALSGYLAGAGDFRLSEAGQNTPVFQGHGNRDPLIRMAAAEKSRSHILAQGHKAAYDFQVYAGMAHSACPAELAHVEQFLRLCLPEQQPRQH